MQTRWLRSIVALVIAAAVAFAFERTAPSDATGAPSFSAAEEKTAFLIARADCEAKVSPDPGSGKDKDKSGDTFGPGHRALITRVQARPWLVQTPRPTAAIYRAPSLVGLIELRI